MCHILRSWMDECTEQLVPAPLHSEPSEVNQLVLEGVDFLHALDAAKLDRESIKRWQFNYSAIKKAGEEKAEAKRELGSTNDEPSSKIPASFLRFFSGLFISFDYLNRDERRSATDFSIIITKRVTREQSGGEVDEALSQWPRNSQRSDRHASKRQRADSDSGNLKTHITLHLHCLNPAVAMADLNEARSLVLTSGTLSPMSSFASELGIQFKSRFEGAHVVDSAQVWVGGLAVGPSGSELKCVYAQTSQLQFQDELGSLLVELIRQIPYGVLVFLPSYGLLNKLRRRWKDNGIWRDLEATKSVFVEQSGGDRAEFDLSMTAYYDKIAETKRRKAGFATHNSGAMFFAVCRGKISEGLDFADNNARGVITIGIPYAALNDVKVNKKKQYNDRYRHKRNLLSGQEWYEVQAFRALNQALGRCIRHRNDWGALVMIDSRFCLTNSRREYLSKWVKERFQPFRQFQPAMDGLKSFVAHNRDRPAK